MKITIDTDASPAQATQPAAGGAGSTGPASGAAESMPSAATSSPTSDLITKALATGAQNAGPAPSLASAAGARGPISASVGGASSETPAMSFSAGTPPAHIYEPQGGCK
jgi:hypothetical protein